MIKKLLFLIIIVSLLLRLYKTQQFFFWNVDEDIFALTVKRILIDYRPVLLGFPIPGGIYLGPLFYYIFSIPYLFVKMDPSGLPYLSAFFGALICFLIYKAGKITFEDRTVGIMGAAVFGFSYLANVYSRILSGLTISMTLPLLVYLILYKNLKEKKPYLLLTLCLLTLIGVQNEGSSFSLLALSILVWLIFRFKVPFGKFMQIVAFFLVGQLPLLIFDLRHNFFISKSFLHFFSSGGERALRLSTFVDSLAIFPKTLSRFLFISGQRDVTAQILPCSDLVTARNSAISMVSLILAVFFLGFFLVNYFLARQRKTFGQKIVFWHLVILVCGLIVFNLFLRGYLYEWMLAIFFPGFSLIVAYCLTLFGRKRLWGKFVVVLFFAAFIFLNLRSLYETKNSFGLLEKSQAVKIAAREIGNKSYSLDSIGSCFAQGYIYLFWYYSGRFPIDSYAHAMFSPGLVPSSSGKSELKVVMVNPSKSESYDFWQKYNFYKSRTQKSIKADDVEVLIIEEPDLLE